MSPFRQRGWQRLKHGLEEAGLDARHFAWPPPTDPNRPPYRGLRPLEAEDAGIFFGRGAPIVEALDTLRGLRDGAAPRLLVILGASGAGKSSFLRAGLFPRLARDDRTFFPLPIIRPERAAISGETGLLRALEGAFEGARIAMPLADLRAAVQGGATTLKPLLQALADKVDSAGPRCGCKTQGTCADPVDRPGRGVVPRGGTRRSSGLSRVAARSAHPGRARHYRHCHYPVGQLRTPSARQRTGRRAPGNARAWRRCQRAPMRRWLKGRRNGWNGPHVRLRSRTAWSIRCSLISRLVAPRIPCRCSPSRWSDYMVSTTPAAI